MGFVDAIDEILGVVPPERQVSLFLRDALDLRRQRGRDRVFNGISLMSRSEVRHAGYRSAPFATLPWFPRIRARTHIRTL